MTSQSFTTTISVDRTAEEVFNAVTDVRGWWSRAVEGGTERSGDEFVFTVPGIHRSEMRLTEVVPNKKVVWLAVDNRLEFVEDKTEWNGTEIHFDISEKNGKTELRFTHIGLVPEFECFDACSTGWSFYINESLRDLITTGTGQPSEFPDEVALRRAAQ
ncbi:SRPBCC family protein [Nocardia sp. CA-107356]|uniref:SRPBCC family protein n=1 Tax=Nocardia sp. CA-107356 TaxID=3239972 RepID=UPI003D8F9DC7